MGLFSFLKKFQKGTINIQLNNDQFWIPVFTGIDNEQAMLVLMVGL